MTRWSAITPTRGRRSALAYGARSTTAAEETTSTDSYTTSGDATHLGQGWSLFDAWTARAEIASLERCRNSIAHDQPHLFGVIRPVVAHGVDDRD